MSDFSIEQFRQAPDVSAEDLRQLKDVINRSTNPDEMNAALVAVHTQQEKIHAEIAAAKSTERASNTQLTQTALELAKLRIELSQKGAVMPLIDRPLTSRDAVHVGNALVHHSGDVTARRIDDLSYLLAKKPWIALMGGGLAIGAYRYLAKGTDEKTPWYKRWGLRVLTAGLGLFGVSALADHFREEEALEKKLSAQNS